MPGGDRTGPWGLGPRTGRRAGFCSGYRRPGFMNRSVFPPFGGRWFGFFSRGWFGRRFWGRRAGRGKGRW